MTDTPYEKAIEEAAKAAGKALDLVRNAGPAIGDIYGLMIGDKISERRKRNLDELGRETRRILDEREVDPKELPEQIGLPLLEAAQSESRAEMRTRWARLLANAMDPSRVEDVRPDFIATLKLLEPIDVLVLEKTASKIQNPSNTTIQPNSFSGELPQRDSQIAVSMEKLVEVRCFKSPNSSHGTYYLLTSYGQEFLHACRA